MTPYTKKTSEISQHRQLPTKLLIAELAALDSVLSSSTFAAAAFHSFSLCFPDFRRLQALAYSLCVGAAAGRSCAPFLWTHTCEECEEKLKELIVQMKKEIANEEKKGTPAKSKK